MFTLFVNIILFYFHTVLHRSWIYFSSFQGIFPWKFKWRYNAPVYCTCYRTSPFPKLYTVPLWTYSATRYPPSEVKWNVIWFFFRQIKTNRTIVSYRRYYCLCNLNRNLRLLSPLAFTVTVFFFSSFSDTKKEISKLWEDSY